MAAQGARFTCETPPLKVGDLTLDLVASIAYRSGTVIELAPRGSRLLEYLMGHAGEACRRKTILEEAWGCRRNTKMNTLTEHIKHLRLKIDAGFETRLVQTVHGVGYRLGPV